MAIISPLLFIMLAGCLWGIYRLGQQVNFLSLQVHILARQLEATIPRTLERFLSAYELDASTQKRLIQAMKANRHKEARNILMSESDLTAKEVELLVSVSSIFEK